MKTSCHIVAALLAALLVGGAPAGAAAPGVDLPVARDLDAAAARLDAAMERQAALVDLDAAIVAYEAALAAMRAALAEAGGQERALQVALAVRRGDDARLLATLQAARRNRPDGPDLHPQGPIAAARARAMMARLDPTLEAAARDIADRLRALEAARALQRDGAAGLGTALERLAAAKTELASRLAFVEDRDPVDAATATALAEAGTLGELAEALAVEAATGDGSSPEGQSLLPPVPGEVLHGYMEPDAAGVMMPGLVWSAPPLSLVRAPADGSVRYAGPFLDYRNIVVLETGDATLVLAGLARRVVRGGDLVERGAPLGMLGGRIPSVDEYVMRQDLETGAGLRESLYVEIRHGRGPVDPVSWFDGIDGGNEREGAQ